MLENNTYVKMPKTKTREITITESQGTFSLFKKGSKPQKYDFEGISILRRLLNNEKAKILHLIKTDQPASIYALAKLLGRDFKAVSEDVKLLERLGFIELVPQKVKNRNRLKPVIIVDTMTIHFKI